MKIFAESLIKQIDQRLQLTGAQWLPRNVPQMLALRCRYVSDQLDLYSLSRRWLTPTWRIQI